ncbi:MAG: tRNA pseudouridine(55) synthase TruB [Acidobacteriota bacterium]
MARRRRRKSQGQGPSGILVVDKPPGWTSHDVVARVRRVTGGRAGHAGTLDPIATGVLVVLLGKATRLAPWLVQSEKEYLVEARLGRVTDTYDREGSVVEEHPVPRLDRSDIERALEAFRGEIEQQVPAFSAVRVGGRRLYEAVRRGEAVAAPTRRVRIGELELLGRQEDRLELRVVCSAGTYVRALVHDLGRRLGCGACVEELRRIRSGEFHIEQACPWEVVEEDWRTYVVPLEALLPDWPRLELPESEAERIRHGNPVPVPGEAADAPTRGAADEWVRLFHAGRLIALGRRQGSLVQPKVVLEGVES